MDTNNYRKLYILIAATVLVAFLGAASFAAPQLTYEELATVSDDHVIITWVTSNEPATSGIEYGVGSLTSTYTTDEGSSRTRYHYLHLTGLYPNTAYVYRVFSTNAASETTYSEIRSFTTLNPPSGQLLFTFASVSDPQVTQNFHDTYGARGRPYNSSEAILDAAVNWICSVSPSFTVIKGDLIDNRSGNIADDAARIKNKINTLKANNPVFPIPGNHEKQTWTSKTAGGWYDTLLQPIFNPETYSATGDFSNYSYDTDISVAGIEDSVYNYSFDYRGYHFIMLDSMRKKDGLGECSGHVNTAWLSSDLAANAGKKTFIFMHNIITNEAVNIPDEVIKEVTGGSTDMSKIDLDNRSEFLNVLNTHKSDIVGLSMGHLHDNNRYYRSGFDFPFVRTAATIQFPVGYNVYKVYSNGYTQNFYKLPYFSEYARDFVSPEAGYSDAYWEQFSLASNYDRNFVINYGDIAVPPIVKDHAPANGSTNVALNQPVIMTFTKNMATVETQNATIVAPAVSSLSYSWSNSDTILTISHGNFAASTGYTVTVGTGAKSKDNVPFASASSFSFTTGTSPATDPPRATVSPITNDMTTDPSPTLSGIATDEYSTISNIEYRISSNGWSAWRPCTALDGSFNENEESFTFTVTPEISRGHHEIQIRTTNAAGITTQTDFAAYAFYYVSDRPEITLKADGTEIINGDPIKADPSFEVTVLTDQGLTLSNLKFYVNGTAESATLTNQLNNRTITYAYYHPTLAQGTYDIRVEATDDSGNLSTKEAVSLLVQTAGDTVVFGVPLNYPNPFDPGVESTTISYNLSRAGDVSLRIFDLAGNQIVKKEFAANQTGGKAGYNEVPWDGRSDSGNYVGNGIYIYLLIADGKVVQNGKGKLTVFKR